MTAGINHAQNIVTFKKIGQAIINDMIYYVKIPSSRVVASTFIFGHFINYDYFVVFTHSL